ncbi:MAG TPA: polysaccharide biosynthesis/export family protein [Longimicrobium sp.]|jgi:protein involved in polysaccharide export with SLBB domain
MHALSASRVALLRGGLLAGALALGLAAVPARAQEGSRLQPTRAELQALLARFEAAAAAPSTAAEEREHARGEAELIRARLQGGDFHPGDQVALEVEGETQLTDTFTVAPGPVLELPTVGDVPLAGVLRSELQQHVRAHLARYIREPVVRARPLVRIAVTGQVRTPGYFTVPAGSLISDVLMAAGGPLPTARLAAARVERGDRRIWEGKAMRDALAQGFTLDQMSLRAGDQVHVPAENGGRAGTLLRAATAVPAALLAVVGLLGAL